MSGGRRGALLGGLGVASVVLLFAGAVGGFLIARPLAPHSLREAAPVTDVRVTALDFADERDARLELVVGPERPVRVLATGVVTALGCTVGRPIPSGSSPLSLDGTPVLALATAVPPWRDLGIGAVGADVTALHAELQRLGFDVSRDGDRMGGATLAGYRAAYAAAGVTLPSIRTIPRSGYLWIPSDSAPVSACPAQLGDSVAPDSPIATLAPALSAARVVSLPDDLVAGDRVFAAGSLSVPIDANGVVPDPSLPTLVQSAEYRRALAGEDRDHLTGKLRLAASVPVTVVPPSSVVATTGGRGCIYDGSRPYPVTVVGSSLGQTYVTFGDRRPDRIELTPTRSTCG